MSNSIDIDTFKLIIKAGVVMGQANPSKDVNELVNIVVAELIELMKE